MPGLYINDGGETSSAIGNILGGIAQQVSPEGQAKAALLSQQTQGADLDNQDKWEALNRRDAAVRAMHGPGGVLQTLGIEPTVPGIAAAVALPPSATPGPGGRIDRVDESQFTPQEAYFANETAAGRNPLNTNLPGLFQTATGGPSTNTTNQNEIYQSQHKPLSGAAGTTTFIDPTKGSVPGNVVTFGDPGTLDAQKQEQSNAVADATMRTGLAAKATDTESVLDTVKQLHDTVAATTPGAVVSDNVRAWLAQHGANVGLLSTREGALLAINQLLKGTVGDSLTAARADSNSPVRGELQQANDLAPDPAKMDDEAFNVLLNRMYKVTARQKEEGGPARLFLNTAPSVENVRTYNNQLEVLRAQRQAQNERDRAPPPAVPAADSDAAPRVATPADIDKLPPNIKFFTSVGPDGSIRVHQIPGR